MAYAWMLGPVAGIRPVVCGVWLARSERVDGVWRGCEWGAASLWVSCSWHARGVWGCVGVVRRARG